VDLTRRLLFFAVLAAGCLSARAQDTNAPAQTTNAAPSTNAAAVAQLREQAQKGDANAQNQLGLLYDLGQGVEKNYTNAVKWFHKAADKGVAQAQLVLGLHYQNGDGVGQDFNEALKWLRKAADQGVAQAAYSVGVCFYEGKGVAQDYREAVKWYQKAADQGDPMAQYNLGICYARGQGVEQDYFEAAEWYRRAANQGQLAAQYNLALEYHDGRGVPRDFFEALKWFHAAADQGDPAAQFDLGFMYANGQGAMRDLVEAYKWYDLADSQNEPNAARNRDALSSSMSPLQVAEAQRLSREFVARRQAGVLGQADSRNSALIGTLPRFTGTGFFVTADGYLLTSGQLAENAARIEVKTKDGAFPATVAQMDAANGVALLKISGNFSALPVASSRGITPGAKVFTIGFPVVTSENFSPEFADGKITSLTGQQNDPREFQMNVRVHSGNAGGPLIDGCGNVVGMVEGQLEDARSLQSISAQSQATNYAIKGTLLNVVLESVPGASAGLKEPNAGTSLTADSVNNATKAVAIVLAY
jgi:TPR repeat protein